MSSPSSSAAAGAAAKNVPDFHMMSLLVTHKLHKRNYPKWRYQIIPILKSQDLWKFVDGTPPPNQNVEKKEDELNSPYHEWERIDQLLHCWLRTTLAECIALQVSGLQTSKDLWDSLYRMFKSQAEAQIQDLQSQLLFIRMNECTLEEYVEQVKVIGNKLRMMGITVKDDELIRCALRGLPNNYDSFKSSINRLGHSLKFNEFEEKLYKFDSEKHSPMPLTGQQPDNKESPAIAEAGTVPGAVPGAGGANPIIESDTAEGKEKPSRASMLVNFLPSKTLFIFDMLISLVYDNGKCDAVGITMMTILMGLCVLSCVFSQFVDSYYDVNSKKLYHGLVTPKGLRLYNSSQTTIYDPRYKLHRTDWIHAAMAVLVFVVFAFSDKRVTECLLPSRKHENVFSQIRRSLPLMVSIVCSGLNLLLPHPRFGVGMRG